MANPTVSSNQQTQGTPNRPTRPINAQPRSRRPVSRLNGVANGARQNLLNAFTAVEGEDNKNNQKA